MKSPNLILWWIAYLGLRFFAHAWFRVRVLTPPLGLTGPVIWAAKHTYYWDIPLLGIVSRRHAKRPLFFEMASFHGYPVLQHIGWLLRQLGGFAVMRPKDLLRLRRKGDQSRDALREMMEDVNRKALAQREETLRANGTYCFFPEGTRDSESVRPFKSVNELEEARGQAEAEDLDIAVVPVVISYGQRPAFRFPWISRTPVEIRTLEPIPVRSLPPAEIASLMEERMREAWRSPQELG